MSGEPPEEVLAALQELGLTEYEARCFVGLTTTSVATASELSDICAVPRSRIYDVADSLADRGLIEVEPGETKRYRAVPIDMAVNKFQRNYQSLIADLEEYLQSLESVERDEPDTGVWTIKGRDNVLDRAQDIIDMADEELFLMVQREGLLVEPCLQRIRAAVNRGAQVIVVSESPRVREMIESVAPGATVIESGAEVLGLPASDGVLGRVVMADRRAVLVATDETGEGGEGRVIGVWASRRENGLVAVLSELLGSWIDASRGAVKGD